MSTQRLTVRECLAIHVMYTIHILLLGDLLVSYVGVHPFTARPGGPIDLGVVKAPGADKLVL